MPPRNNRARQSIPSSSNSTARPNVHNYSNTYVEMRQVVASAVDELRDARPKATKRQYEPKQREFRNWCDVKFASEPVETRYTVNGDKLTFFLQTEV